MLKSINKKTKLQHVKINLKKKKKKKQQQQHDIWLS